MDSALAQETPAYQELASADFTPGRGSVVIPIVQDAERHLKKAGDIAAQGAPSPFDDVGAKTVNAIVNEEMQILAIYRDYGQSDVSPAIRNIERAHQQLLTIRAEVRARGY